MNNTLLHVYPGCFGPQVEHTKRKTLVLHQGDIIFFRGDLAHAGAKHKTVNYRLHSCVCLKGIKRKPNATDAVAIRSFRCPKCTWLEPTRAKLAKHKRHCTVEEEKENHREERDQGDAVTSIKVDEESYKKSDEESDEESSNSEDDSRVADEESSAGKMFSEREEDEGTSASEEMEVNSDA
ncbi:hypothetical protein PF005_g706 [Phytophthora fragariae]|nr:hypothetical protein PF003_g8382 [Phytophthora fragariae]KAE9237292.1 hypothetical protein PF005_g706 [Phytophthora fragariae]